MTLRLPRKLLIYKTYTLNLVPFWSVSGLRETELRLQKEIKEVEARLQREIKGLELQIKEVEAGLQERIAQVEVSLHKAMAAQTRWLIGGLAILGTVFKLADLFIGP